jgi:FAD:protein FMN transferase
MNEKKKEDFHRFTHGAMGTVFEIKISKSDFDYAKAAAAEAFRLLDILEQYLSHYIANSDISRISNLDVGEWTKVSVETYECLQQCVDMYSLTGGVFDVTLGWLYKTWLNENMTLKAPTFDEISKAKKQAGLFHLSFDETQFQVGMNGGPVRLDLGGFGKGYALDKLAEFLREWDLDSYLINGGQSSMLFGEPPEGANGWDITLSDPFNDYKEFRALCLKNIAISGSGLKKGRHIIDPRSGEPIDVQRSTWAFAPTAAFADGLSTSFMILSFEETAKICKSFPAFKAMILSGGSDAVEKRLTIYGTL